ncbi:bifunctional hydroxymethylpyrimidine kinase/phosphomethylpyrimidine kinase [Rhizobium sp. CFBP 8762]|uniref:bifunctional hydroxymethylpyrimidine kinase/phosphomethylpyrimidine kinase n=1 Tax=Rhizobium sp. CFBP 8762 TaxID=2775279 RepID=UPI00177B42D8|nr:bifunctional hydroxymethylpyrimidine kinase/phosphomethylpyrimidine kinase [Rhizobium sp. CFBP 8762]MBD8555292.1 bifunctional hydroxymethylpyrimidine kinase/phosphomethylpyrimidine kinase [Rhizobium sp. CFBP 8762]
MTAIALTIAGSDSGGGAGIQADLKTFSALGVYGASVLTAITAQNTHGVTAIENLTPGIIGAQIDAVLSDLDVGAIKIGMVSRAVTAEVIAERLRHWQRLVVLDPVMVATSGDTLLEADAISALRRELLPLSLIVTPNLPEAALLADDTMAESEADIARQARLILAAGARAVLIKGGHGHGAESTDFLYDGTSMQRFTAPRLDTTHDHGTGCTLSAAIAAGLASGQTLLDAVASAKAYLHAALSSADALKIGTGRGPVHHFHAVWKAGT